MKAKRKKAVTTVGNMRIRAEAPAKAQARVQNALLRNKLLAQQQAQQYKLGLERLDSAAVGTPALQRDHILMGRGELQSKYDNLKFA